MGNGFSIKVAVALGIGVGTLIVLGVLAYRDVGEFSRADREVQRLLAVQEILESIRLDLMRAEMSQLRYQLTGESVDRHDFRAIPDRVAASIEQLERVLVVEDQKSRLKELERAVAERLEALEQAARLRSSDRAAALSLSIGVEPTNRIEKAAGAIGERERQMMKMQRQQAYASSISALRITMAGAALSILLLAWAILVITRFERDRVRVEGELRAAEERLALALEGSNSAVWDWDLKRDLIYLSAGWSGMLGNPATDSTMKPAQLLALVHPDDRDRVQEAARQAVTGIAADYRAEHRVLRTDGEWIWIFSHGKVVRRDPDGRAVRVTGTNLDISDRKTAEIRLQQQGERLRLALETAGMASWNWDVALDRFEWQGSPQPLAGPEPADGYPSLRDMVHHEDLVHSIQALGEAARTGATYRDECRIIRTDGSLAWALLRGQPERDAAGNVVRVMGVAQDITEIKEAEHALLAREHEVRLVMDSVPAFIGYADASERVLYCNHGLARLLGARPEEVVGRPLRTLYGEEVYRVLEPHVRRALAGEKVRFQRSQPAHDGGSIELDVTYVPRRDALGAVEGFYSLSTDIGELRRLDRMKTEFVSTVSHELRTPLTSIRGSLGLLAGGVAGPLPDKARGFVDIALGNCERLVRLINDILDMEKIESGKMGLRMRVIDVMELVEAAVRANEGFAAQHNVSLKVTASRPGSRVHADSDRLAQVLTNLISNACKFSSPGQCVEIAVSGEGQRCRIAIVDHGPGIPEEFRSRIFQKFSQADASDVRMKGGTGLGLSISKAIVEGLGGEIGFETEPGKGSTFFFWLPELREELIADAT